jgi:probable F420-dependent oxidoreductase
MHIGIFSFNTEYTMRADRLAHAVEERGFESLWLPEHTHIPVPADGSNDVRDPAGGILPVEYRHMSDPFTSLAAAAAATQRIKLGLSICLINQHHPINLAKHVSTLDRLSDGRVIFGVGAGWNRGEMGHHGVQFEDRWKQVAERVDALKTIWREEKPSFRGKFVQFEPFWQYPKPLQQPHPPIVLGTLDTPFGRAQVAKYGDGWLPLTFDVAKTRASVADVHKRMHALGRNPDTLEVSLFFLEDKLQNADVMKQARDTGATRSIMRLPVADEPTVLRALDHYARLLS